MGGSRDLIKLEEDVKVAVAVALGWEAALSSSQIETWYNMLKGSPPKHTSPTMKPSYQIWQSQQNIAACILPTSLKSPYISRVSKEQDQQSKYEPANLFFQLFIVQVGQNPPKSNQPSCEKEERSNSSSRSDVALLSANVRSKQFCGWPLFVWACYMMYTDIGWLWSMPCYSCCFVYTMLPTPRVTRLAKGPTMKMTNARPTLASKYYH